MKFLKAEHMKLKHTFGRKLPVIAPCIILLLALVLTGGIANAFPAGAWNWWYSIFLSGTLSVLCSLSVKKEKKIKFHNMLLLKTLPWKSWLAKIVYCSLGLLFSNAVMYAGTLLGGAVFGTTISPGSGLSAAILLTVGYLWEIPLFLFLSARFGMFASVFTGIFLSVSGIFAVSESSRWWIYPAAVPVRLMCPVLRLLPNGLPVPSESVLVTADVILPGTLLSILWFAVFAAAASVWFERWEGKGE